MLKLTMARVQIFLGYTVTFLYCTPGDYSAKFGLKPYSDRFLIRDWSSDLAVDLVTITDSGNVGIGTAEPEAKLHIYDSSSGVYSLKLDTSGSVSPDVQFALDGNNKALMYLDRTTEDLRFQTGGSERVTIQSNGNVGIGTTSPDAEVDIQLGTNDEEIRLSTSDPNRWGTIQQTWQNLVFKTRGYEVENDAAAVIFKTGTTEKEAMRIVNGKIGIGLDSPKAALHTVDSDKVVRLYQLGNGAAQRSIGFDVGDMNDIFTGSIVPSSLTKHAFVFTLSNYNDVETDQSAFRIIKAKTTNSKASIYDPSSYTDVFYVKNDSKIGIGKSDPDYKLDVNGDVKANSYHGDGSQLTGISGTTDNDWTIAGDNVYHEAGKVGIGTDNPAHKLDVVGNARVSGTMEAEIVDAQIFTAPIGQDVVIQLR